jgi:TatD DNase family protein
MNPPKYIDIHAHTNFAAYDADRDLVIRRALDSGVAIVNVGTQKDTSRLAVELAQKYDGVFATVALHPVHTSKSFHDEKELGPGGKTFTSRGEVFDVAIYRYMASDPKVVAIGECGLDYYHMDDETKKVQQDVFRAHIELANELEKPLMLHIRNAYADAYQIFKAHAKVHGHLHFFAGTWQEAKLFLDLGCTFSFTGVITFARNYDEVVRGLPLDRIMAETDCPYVAPAPYRGRRNEPAYVVEVVKAIADIRGEDFEKVREAMVENALRVFGLQ